jgi:hypothetical protein
MPLKEFTYITYIYYEETINLIVPIKTITGLVFFGPFFRKPQYWRDFVQREEKSSLSVSQFSLDTLCNFFFARVWETV